MPFTRTQCDLGILLPKGESPCIQVNQKTPPAKETRLPRPFGTKIQQTSAGRGLMSMKPTAMAPAPALGHQREQHSDDEGPYCCRGGSGSNQ